MLIHHARVVIVLALVSCVCFRVVLCFLWYAECFPLETRIVTDCVVIICPLLTSYARWLHPDLIVGRAPLLTTSWSNNTVAACKNAANFARNGGRALLLVLITPLK